MRNAKTPISKAVDRRFVPPFYDQCLHQIVSRADNLTDDIHGFRILAVLNLWAAYLKGKTPEL